MARKLRNFSDTSLVTSGGGGAPAKDKPKPKKKRKRRGNSKTPAVPNVPGVPGLEAHIIKPGKRKKRKPKDLP